MLASTRFWLATFALLALALPAWAAGDEGGHTPGIWEGGVGNSIITLIIFGIVVWILGAKAWPPLLKTLDERSRQIRASLENARREREQTERLLAQYQQQIDQARKEATAIVDEGRRDADVVRRRLQDEAKREADEMIARARREIELATNTALKELYDQTAELAVRVAGGIIHKELRAEDHRGLVSESLERMKATRN